MFGQSSKSQKSFFAQPMGVNDRESSDQIFQLAVISDFVSEFGWDPFSDLRDQASKKDQERKKKLQRWNI